MKTITKKFTYWTVFHPINLYNNMKLNWIYSLVLVNVSGTFNAVILPIPIHFVRLYICQQTIVIGTKCMNCLCHMTWWICESRAQPYKVPFCLCLYHWHGMAHRTRHTIANGKCKTLTFKVLAHSMYV